MEKSLLEVLKTLKLDFTSAIIELDNGLETDKPFELSPRDFLRFAKSDLKQNDLKGNINALTNAKRAIDCQIDSALTTFGIDCKNIPETSNEIIQFTEFTNEDLAYKLKIIRALDFAPSGLISRTRTLRNKLEHNFQVPHRDEVKDAIELAEFFLLSLDSHLNLIENEFYITDQQNFSKFRNHKKYVKVTFDDSNSEIRLDFSLGSTVIHSTKLSQHQSLYYFLVKLINNLRDELDAEDAFKTLLKAIGHPIPSSNIKLKLK